MKNIIDFTFEGKKVILRCDFNVTIKEGQILSDERIKASLKTINYLIDKKAKVILLSHLGKVKTKDDIEKNTLFPVYQKLCELLKTNVYFSSATRGTILENKISYLQDGEVLLVENTRYEDYPDKKESKCDEELSKYWASLGDIFINDAFAMTHRQHASNYGIAKYLPHAMGFLIEEEIKGLEIVSNPDKPFCVIMGGAKVEDKLDIIKGILPKCDYLLVGGGIANSFLNINYNVGLSLKDDSKKEELKELLSLYKDKIILPIDYKVLNNGEVKQRKYDKIEDDDNILDIGENTLSIYKERINSSATIFLNGTMGKYEQQKEFENGTKEILQAILSSKAKTVIGGGDAISSAEYFNVKGFTFVSTGGGATLEYLATGKLKCFERE
mgnify:CR=1 FL=1